MKITLTLQIEDPDDYLPGSESGLTSAAYDRLYDAITDAGFAVVDGPQLEEAT